MGGAEGICRESRDYLPAEGGRCRQVLGEQEEVMAKGRR